MDKPDTAKPGLRAAFTGRMVAALKENKIPWRQPWSGNGMPHNAATDRPYTGGNRLMLALAGMEQGHSDPRWLTFNQAKALGGQVRKGEHATPIEYWDSKPFWMRRDVTLTHYGKAFQVDAKRAFGSNGNGVPTRDGHSFVHKGSVIVEQDGKKYSWKQAEALLNTLVAKTHSVFNVQQCDGLELKPLGEKIINPEQRGEQLAKAMQRDGVGIQHGAGGAFYRPGADSVNMPPRATFNSVEGYYGTLLHELGHATGHENRLNREGVVKGGISNAFGTPGYAKEELVAEMTSAFLAMETGIPFDDDNHKAYIQNWADVLEKDENAIFRAAREAGAAANFMLTKEQALVQEQDNGQEPSPEQALRTMWTEQGVSTERQDALIAGIAAQAQPGAQVGPFVLAQAIPLPAAQQAGGEAQHTAPEQPKLPTPKPTRRRSPHAALER
jgi:antirestriction protein ArdC